jgi:uncharacterized protein (UPF0216 family)
MSIRKFEDKMLKQINQLDEGIITGIIKMILAPQLKRTLKKLDKEAPEMVTTIDGLQFYAEELQKFIEQLKKEAKSKNKIEAALAKETLKNLKIK